MRTTLDDAKAFFEEIVKTSHDAFITNPSTFSSAFNAATALFHMHEWVYEFKKSEIESKYAQPFSSKGAFWGFVESSVFKAKYIRDLANSAKHIRLTIKPSTSMTHIANTSIRIVRYGEGAYGAGRYSAASIVMKDNAADISLDECVTDLFAFWRNLIGELYT